MKSMLVTENGFDLELGLMATCREFLAKCFKTVKSVVTVAVVFSSFQVFSETYPESQQFFIDPDFPSIRYYYSLHAGKTDSEVCITRIDVSADVNGPVDIVPGNYAWFWKLRVVKIGPNAFSNCRKIRSVTLPDGLISIGAQAFYNCSELESVSGSLSKNTVVGYGAFSACAKLKSLTLGISELGANACRGCSSLSVVKIGNVSTIGESAFEGCVQLSELRFNLGLSSVGNKAFSGCTNLKTIVYDGACPVCTSDIYAGTREDLISIAGNTANGWPTSSTMWMGRSFQFVGLNACCHGPTTIAGTPIVLTSTAGGYITYYTTDGLAPGISTQTSQCKVGYAVFLIDSDAVVNAILKTNDGTSLLTKSFAFSSLVSPPVCIVTDNGADGKILTLKPSRSGQEVYYSFGSEDLTIDSRKYVDPIVISGNTTVNAFAVQAGCRSSYAVTTSIVCSVSTPVISSAGFNGTSYEVEISCATPASTIHYTINGTTPTANSPVYTGAFKLSRDSTVKAVAIRNGWKDSAVAAKSFSTSLSAMVVDSIDLSAIDPWNELLVLNYSLSLDVETKDPQLYVEARITDNVTGLSYVSSPDAYLGPCIMNKGDHSILWHTKIDNATFSSDDVAVELSIVSVDSMGVKSVLQSVKSSKRFTVDTIPQVINIDSADTVSLCANLDWTTNSLPGDGAAFSVDGKIVLQTTDVANIQLGPCHFGTNHVECCTVNDGAPVAPPISVFLNSTNGPEVIITPGTDTVFSSYQKVTITSTEPDAVVHYTLDGSMPTAESPVFTKRNITTKTTLTAVAIRPNGYVGCPSTVSYGLGKCDSPRIYPADISHFESGDIEVSIEAAEGDDIFYTLNGGDPVTDGILYVGPFRISGNTVIKAIAVNSSFLKSEVATASYNRITATPLICAESAFIGESEEVEILCEDRDAKIYYTVDGSTPTVSTGIRYGGKFSVSDSTMVRAIAMVDGFDVSSEASYQITALTPPSGVNNTLDSFSAVYGGYWDSDFHFKYSVSGNQNATNVIGYLYAIYAGMTNRLYSVELDASAGQHAFTWNPSDDGFSFTPGASVRFVLQFRRADESAPFPCGVSSSTWFGRNRCYQENFLSEWKRTGIKGPQGLPCWACVKDSGVGYAIFFDMHTMAAGKIWFACRTCDVSSSGTFRGCMIWYKDDDIENGTFYEKDYPNYPTSIWYAQTFSLKANQDFGLEWFSYGAQCNLANNNYLISFGGEVDFVEEGKEDTTGISNLISIPKLNKVDGKYEIYVEDSLDLLCDVTWDGCERQELYINENLVYSTSADGVYEFLPEMPGEYRVVQRAYDKTKKVGERSIVVRVTGPAVSLMGDVSTEFVYSHDVSLTCSDERAAIYYTIDGSTPDEGARKYDGPFCVDRSVVVNAVGIFPSGKRGEVATWSFVRKKTISDVLGMPDLRVNQDDGAPWTEDSQTLFFGKPSLRSGQISEMQSSILSAHFALKEPGVIKFHWMASCEDDPDFDDWDYGVFMLNGEEICRIDGATDWMPVRVELPTGEYDAKWIYRKDESDEPSLVGDDCVWLAKLEIGTPAMVVFDDGENVISNETAIGCVPIVPEDPHKEHICFMGWDGDVTKPIVSNTTFRAIWEHIVHTVEFVVDEGCKRIGGGELSQTVDHGYCAEVPVIEAGKGMRFVGWEGDVAAPIISNSQFVAKIEYDGATGKTGSLTWIIIEDTGELIFHGNGEIPDNAYMSWTEYSKRIKSIVVPNTITSIGYFAFRNASNVTNVEISASVKSIGSGAFSGCSSIISMTLPFVGSARGNVYRRNDWEKLFGHIFGSDSYVGGKATAQYYSSNEDYTWKYYIPESLTTVNISDETIICRGAFSNCSGIKSVTIPESVTRIEEKAFRNCNGLGTGVVIQNGCVLTVGSDCPENVVLPENVRLIADAAFQGCRLMKSITVPTNVTSIGNAAFSGCSSITNMVLPYVGIKPGIAGTSDSVFGAIFGKEYGMTRQYYSAGSYEEFRIPMSLKSVTISGSCKIGYGAFYNCSRLMAVTLCEGVSEICERAFYGCSSLASITIPSSVGKIGTHAFDGCSALKKVTIEDGVKEIGDGVFYSCKNLSAITIPSSVAKIGTAFYGCTGLGAGIVVRDDCVLTVNGNIVGDLILPEGIRLVAGEAFRGCKSMRSVVVPKSVGNIGYAAFSECSGLTNMVLPFVGGQRNRTGSDESLFGYIFGSRSYSGGVQVKQFYVHKWDPVNYVCYIPASLKRIEITDVTEIAPSAFNGCSGLVAIEIPSNIGRIGDYSFGQCSGLLSMNIPDGVEHIGLQAFHGCSSLQTLRIPYGVLGLDSLAFEECSELRLVTIPSSVKTIGQNAFMGCDKLNIVCVSKGDVARVKELYSWPQNVAFVEGEVPTITDDDGAAVSADGADGIIIKPSEGNLAVEVAIPPGGDAAKVTVEVSLKVATVKANGAKVKVVNGIDDITEFLSMPDADANGVLDLTKATVKEEFVEEAMDSKKGAVIELNAANPILTTPNTRKGLFYQLREGVTLEGMKDGDSTIGNGEPWSPKITVKGGNSAFYSIGVGKGE